VAVAREGAESAKEGVLRGVFGKGRVAGDAARRRQGRGGSKARQLGEGVLVSAPGALDQLRLARARSQIRAGRAARGRKTSGRRQEEAPRKASKDRISDSE
jgi:hypothetical protein